MSPDFRAATSRAAIPVAQPGPAPTALRTISPAVLAQVVVPPILPVIMRPAIPVANTQMGNLFEDQSNSSVRWYLPSYKVSGTDASFGFAASQSGVDSNGNPFNKCMLVFSLRKTVPDDVNSFHAANPNVELREIPLHFSSVTLVTAFKDAQTGQPSQKSYPATGQTVLADGTLVLTFDNILGAGVVILFENLTTDGGAQVTLISSADVVLRVPAESGPVGPPLGLGPRMMFMRPAATQVGVAPFLLIGGPAVRPGSFAGGASDRNGPWNYIRTTLSNTQGVALNKSFADPQYQMKYTISTQAGTRQILNVQDLEGFDLNQTEYSELKALGDISQRYPSMSGLYLGVLSKTILVIPRYYAIVRSSHGCMAVCQALLDSSPSRVSRCKFEFAFVLAPGISPVELLQLSEEIANHADFRGYVLKLPDLLADHPPATLATVFQSSFRYSVGLQPHSFTLTVEIRDQDLDSPAVANANLLLKALNAPTQPYLTGTLGLKLDDGYPSPVQSGVVLNFAETSGTDELSFSVDEGGGTIQLQNRSPFDLSVARCALGVGQTITVCALNQTLANGASATIPLPADHAGIAVMADAQLALPSPVTKNDLARYLTFQIQDVQDTQFELSVNASGVDFDAKGIDHMDVQVTFPALPQIVPAAMSLNKLHTTDGTQVLIPIQNAVTELAGTASFTVHFADAGKQPTDFTMQNDFCENAILVVSGSDIP